MFHYLLTAPLVVQLLCIGIGLGMLYVLFSFLLAPILWLYNQVTDKNRSNVDVETQYDIGEITVKIVGNRYGEVRDNEHQSLYPARLFQQQEQENQEVYEVGTKVLIIEFDQEGVARVARVTPFLESRDEK